MRLTPSFSAIKSRNLSFDAGLQKNNSLTLSTKTIGELSCEKPFFKLEMPISPVLKTLTNSSSSPSVSYEQITFPLSSPHIPILGTGGTGYFAIIEE